MRSKAMEDLWVVRRSEETVEEGRSMRRTEAPLLARRRPQKGPGARPPSSRTLSPVSGGGAVMLGMSTMCFSCAWKGEKALCKRCQKEDLYMFERLRIRISIPSFKSQLGPT